jgi:molybdopterin converting factor small subunit
MPRINFTPSLMRHIECPPRAVKGDTVRRVLEQVFADNPKLRGYVLDDQARLRKHVAIFVDARQIHDRDGLSDRVAAESEVFVMQALSGG